jgi:hypothetical protein
VREAFERAGYTAEGLVGVLGPADLPSRVSPELAHVLGLTAEPAPLNTLIRLFLLGVPVDAAAARAAFEPAGAGPFLDAGLVAASGEKVSSLVRVLAFRGLLLACDHIAPDDRELVVGITNSVVTLNDFAIRRRARRTLDLGTGCGVLALAASGHSDEVFATDLSERAVEFAAFNAALNGAANITALAGDCFEPVRGRRFDLIVSNPPYVISPGVRFTYRDSGVGADGFAQRLVRESPAFLKEGGFFQVVCDCVHTAGKGWRERVSEWLAGSGCDAWIMAVDTASPSAYVNMWTRDTEHGSREERARVYEDWVRHLESSGIEAITTLLVAMRRRSGSNWLRVEDAPGAAGPFGEDIARGFALRDYLTATNDDALMDEVLTINPATRLEQEFEPSGGKWKAAALRVRIGQGLRYEGTVDGRIASLLASCDGTRPVRDLVAGVAERAGVPAERIATECLSLLRQLIERGYLRPRLVA